MSDFRIFQGIYHSPIGRIYLYADSSVLIYADFDERVPLKLASVAYRLERNDDVFVGIFTQFDEYFSGKRMSFEIPFDIKCGSEFQKKVWHEIKKIPYGKTRSYKEISIAAGKPNAFRAVGNCCRQNPLVLIIPCHRVIMDDGRTGNYKGGIEKKIYLLELEAKNNVKI